MAELPVGAKAPEFSLPGVHGGTVEGPAAPRGPGAPLTLLTVFKSSCPTCKWALPFFQTLHEKVEASAQGAAAGGKSPGPGGDVPAAPGLRVIGIAEDTPEEAKALADELGLTFPIGVEGDPWETSAAYGLATVPTQFLVDGNGEILMTSPGFARDDILEAAKLAAERAGSEPVDPFPEVESVPPFRPG